MALTHGLLSLRASGGQPPSKAGRAAPIGLTPLTIKRNSAASLASGTQGRPRDPTLKWNSPSGIAQLFPTEVGPARTALAEVPRVRPSGGSPSLSSPSRHRTRGLARSLYPSARSFSDAAPNACDGAPLFLASNRVLPKPNNRSAICRPRSNPSSVNQIDLFLFTGLLMKPFSCNRLVVSKSNRFQARPSSKLKIANRAHGFFNEFVVVFHDGCSARIH